MTAFFRLLARYRHRKAFRASLVKNKINVPLLVVGMQRFNGINQTALSRAIAFRAAKAERGAEK